MSDLRQLSAQLRRYGLSDTESRIYIFLLRESHELSVVQIARTLKLGRTPVYNALDKLEEKGLISRVISGNGFNFAATSPDHLEQYWNTQTQNTQRLTERLPSIVSALESMTAGSGYQSQVNYFTGRRGIEQITYNSLKAQNDLYIYEINSDMTAFMKQETAERFRQIWVERGTTIHQLTNRTEFQDFTEVEQIISLWDIRHIDPKILKIDFETVIYNDTVALYSYINREVFGVEIKNPNLAQMQTQIFKAMQHLATPMTVTSPKGAAQLPPQDS